MLTIFHLICLNTLKHRTSFKKIIKSDENLRWRFERNRPITTTDKITLSAVPIHIAIHSAYILFF